MKVEQPPTEPPGITQDVYAGADLTAHASVRLGLAFGHFVFRFRWILLALWLVLLGVSVPFALKLPAILSGGGYSFSGSESVHVSNDLINKLHFPPSSITIVLQSTTTSVSDPSYQQELQSILGKLRPFHNVSSIQTGGIGQDGRTTFINVNFDKNYDYMQKYVGDLRALMPGGASAHPAQIYFTGQLAVTDELNTSSQQDAERADATVFPLALLILLVVFGTFSAAIMPLVLALVSIPLALASIYPIASAAHQQLHHQHRLYHRPGHFHRLQPVHHAPLSRGAGARA